MKVQEPVFVCGSGRCGSSLVMQMLQAGGYPCLGEFPAFEPDEVGFPRSMSDLFAKCSTMAAKILDPHRTPDWPKIPVSVIWLDRNRDEQAKSMLKMARYFGETFTVKRRALAASLREDRKKAFALFAENDNAHVLELSFERILMMPATASETIATFLDADLDLAAMERAVIKRAPACRPDMEIEFEAVKAGRA